MSLCALVVRYNMAPSTNLFFSKKKWILALIGLSVVFLFGLLLGYLIYSESNNKFDDVIIKKALDDVDSSRLRDTLLSLSRRPHMTGSKRDAQLLDMIVEFMESSGLDHVEKVSYDFLISLPDETQPNRIHLLKNNQVEFTSHYKEKESSEDFVAAFHAYSPSGEVEGPLIYVNYGRVEDLKLLNELGIELEGKIAICRYGKIFRGNKVTNCQRVGMKGVIMFSDPEEVAPFGTEPSDVYPNTFFLPGTGIQRGSVVMGDGDLLSPGWPSITNAYRLPHPNNNSFLLPLIPSQPIGYDDASVLLRSLTGSMPPNGWKGKLNNVSYLLGNDPLSPYVVQLFVYNKLSTIKDSNVIGYLRGSEEPDRYVLLSNHRDAWGYGAIDPSSGTAQLLESIRVLGDHHKRTGWRPSRTIVFCSWAAEEFGLLGSNEWVSHKIHKIMHRAVGVINTDICVSGPIVKPQASPALMDLVLEALQNVPDPTSNLSRSYFDFWKNWGAPEVKLLGSGSDHAPFAFYAGIPSINLRFKDDTKKYKGLGQYPMYHTGYETFELMSLLLDPEFKIHKTCTQTSLYMLLKIASSPILPYNLSRIPDSMFKILNEFDSSNITYLLSQENITLEHIKDALKDFEGSAKHFMEELERKKENLTPLERRLVNDQIFQLEKVFLLPNGLPDRRDVRHAIFAPAKFNQYGSSGFPGITDLLFDLSSLSSHDKYLRVETLKKHVSDLMIIMQSASSFLSSPEYYNYRRYECHMRMCDDTDKINWLIFPCTLQSSPLKNNMSIFYFKK